MAWVWECVCVAQHLGHTGPDGTTFKITNGLTHTHAHTFSHIHVDAHTSANKFINAPKGIEKGEVRVLWRRPPPFLFFPSVAFHTSQLFTGLFVVCWWPGLRHMSPCVCVCRNECHFTHTHTNRSGSHIHRMSFVIGKTIPYAPAAQP